MPNWGPSAHMYPCIVLIFFILDASEIVGFFHSGMLGLIVKKDHTSVNVLRTVLYQPARIKEMPIVPIIFEDTVVQASFTGAQCYYILDFAFFPCLHIGCGVEFLVFHGCDRHVSILVNSSEECADILDIAREQ